MESKTVVRDSDSIANSAFSPVYRPHNVDDRSNSIKTQMPSSHATAHKDNSNQCHFDATASYLKRLPVPLSTSAAVQDPGYVSLEWPSRASSYASRSSVSSSLASTKTEASATAVRGPGVWNGQKVSASQPNIHDDRNRQTTPPNNGYKSRHVGGLSGNLTNHHLDHSYPPNHSLGGSNHQVGCSLTRHFGGLSNHGPPHPTTMTVNGWSRGNLDTPTKSGPGDVVRVHQQSSVTGVESLRSADCRQLCRTDTVGSCVRNKRPDEVPVNGDVISELQRRLAERGVELKALRDTMERNELAMQRVLEDRKKVWEAELVARRADWQQTIEDHREQSRRSENVLRLQVAHLEGENAMLRSHSGREHMERELELELKTAHETVNQLTSELHLRRSEVRELRAVIDRQRTPPATHPDVVGVMPPCACSVATGSWRTINASTNMQPSTKDALVSSYPGVTDNHADNSAYRKSTSGDVTSGDETSRLRQELTRATSQLESDRREFDEERRQWTMEKEQVIAYQKHLQLNYVQLARRSATLHLEKQQLVSELWLLEPAKSCFLEGREQTTYLDESHC